MRHSAAGTPSFIVHQDGRAEIAVTNADTDLALSAPLIHGQCQVSTTRNGAEPSDAIDIAGFGVFDPIQPRSDGKGEGRPLRYVRLRRVTAGEPQR